MHSEALEWLKARAAEGPACVRVLELGSRNINGSARVAWPGADWLGVDLVPGAGVHVAIDAGSPEMPVRVAAAARMAMSRQPDGGPRPGFDVVVCAETLEHAEDPEAIVRNAYRCLKSGGRFLMTCAAEPRAPHSGADGGALRPGEHYANVDPATYVRWLAAAGFRGPFEPEHHTGRGDLYAAATK